MRRIVSKERKEVAVQILRCGTREEGALVVNRFLRGGSLMVFENMQAHPFFAPAAVFLTLFICCGW